MPRKRMALELGMGTDIRGGDCTKAAARAVRDALWRNTLSIAKVCGQRPEDMLIELHLAVPRPETVDLEVVREVFPYGEVDIELVQGGLEIPTDDGADSTLIAHAGVVVCLDLPDVSS